MLKHFARWIWYWKNRITIRIFYTCFANIEILHNIHSLLEKFIDFVFFYFCVVFNSYLFQLKNWREVKLIYIGFRQNATNIFCFLPRTEHFCDRRQQSVHMPIFKMKWSENPCLMSWFNLNFTVCSRVFFITIKGEINYNSFKQTSILCQLMVSAINWHAILLLSLNWF